MSLQHVRPLLSAYVDGEATAAERRQVDEHLVRCAECAQVLAEYRAIGSSVRAMPRPVPPPTLHRDVWTAIEANRGRNVWGANLAGLLRWGALGATALAAIVIAFIIWKPQTPAAGVQMTRPANGQTNVGVNSPVILQFSPAVQEYAKDAVTVSRNVDPRNVYSRWLAVGTDLVLGPGYPPGLTPGPDTPPPQWPTQTVITISITGPVYTADGKTVVIAGGEVKQFTFTTGTKLDPTDTPSPVPTNTPTPVPPTETPVPPTPVVPPTETPFTQPTVEPPPQPTVTAQTPPTQEPPPGIVTETPVVEPPTKQPTQPVPPTVTTQAEPPTKQPTQPVPPSATPHPPVPTQPVPPSATPLPPTTTPVPPTTTPVLPTTTPVPPTNTPLPTPVATFTPVLPSPQVTVTVPGTPLPGPPPTETPVNNTPPRTPTLVPLSGTPRVPTSTPATTPSVVVGCPITPQHGFGQVYNDTGHAALRQALGCPTVAESAFTYAAEQNFEHGYMFWDGDGKRVYVFSTTTSTWRSYADTWVEGEAPSVVLTPPAGYYQPVRGFGKVWIDYPEVRTALGWATGQEHGGAAAWQAFAHGAMLWTDSHIIRVLYDNGGWELYYDTYTAP